MNFRTSPPQRSLALLGALVTLAAAPPARACKQGLGAPTISAPAVPVEQLATVAVREDRARLACDRIPRRGPIACTWRARYVLEHTGEAATIPLTVEFPTGAVIRLELDGVVVARAHTVDLRPPRERRELPAQQTVSADWSAPQDGRVELIVSADLHLDPWQSHCGPDTNHRRHPVLNPWRSTHHRFNYGRASPLVADSPWGLEVDTPRAWRPGLGESTVRAGRRIHVHDGRPPLPGEPVDHLVLDRPLRRDRGGPIAAVGLGFAPGGVAPRLRLGWELAWPDALVHTLAVETDARRRLVLVPAWEGALSFLHDWFVDLGLGLGVPVQVVPVARPGARVLARIGARVIHLLGVYDVYPAFRGAPVEHHGALMLQAGL